MNTRFLNAKLASQGLTPEQLADKLGLSASYTRLICKGLTPARHTTRLIALVLQCSVEELQNDPRPGGGGASA